MSAGRASHRSRGFTLIETLAVLAILGLLTATALSRFDTGPAELSMEVETVRGHIRYAQAMAMLHGETWGLNLSAGSYDLFRVDAGGVEQAADLPGQSGPVDLSARGLSLATDTPRLTFNAWGVPVDILGRRAAGDAALTLSKSGETAAITVTRDTGLVP